MRVEVGSPTWIAVRGEAVQQIELATRRLETAGLTLGETENERGFIRAMRLIAKMGEPDPVILVSEAPPDGGY